MTDHNRCYCSTHTHGIEGGFGPLPPKWPLSTRGSLLTHDSTFLWVSLNNPRPHACSGGNYTQSQSHSGSGVCNIFQRNGRYYSTGTTTVICFIHSPQVDVCLPHSSQKKTQSVQRQRAKNKNHSLPIECRPSVSLVSGGNQSPILIY